MIYEPAPEGAGPAPSSGQEYFPVSLPSALTLIERLRYRSLWKNLRGEFKGELDRLEEGLRKAVQGAAAPLPEAALGLLGAGGKRVRPLLAWLSAAVVGARPALADPIALAAELTHAATLLHDDVLDDAAQRRGVPAARILHGNRISVLAGDFLLTRALESVLPLRSEEILGSYTACLRQMVEGEVIQQNERFKADVDESVYRDIIARKTAALFAWAAKAGALAGGADAVAAQALERFGLGMGSAFQILDDLLDWVGEGTLVGKAVRGDLKEGKPSLAVIYGCQESKDVRSWFEAHLRPDAPAPAEEEISRLAGQLTTCGALARVREALQVETARAVSALDALADTPQRSRLSRFAGLLLAREK